MFHTIQFIDKNSIFKYNDHVLKSGKKLSENSVPEGGMYSGG